MAYIDGEVRATCEVMGWGYQIRRKWSAREKPVAQSTIDDLEWKIIPDAQGRIPEAAMGDFEGVYYVLSFNRPKGSCVLQHDTSHCGVMGPHWEEATYTEICPNLLSANPEERSAKSGHPPTGWLRDHLQRLVVTFRPNTFSIT